MFFKWQPWIQNKIQRICQHQTVTVFSVACSRDIFERIYAGEEKGVKGSQVWE